MPNDHNQQHHVQHHNLSAVTVTTTHVEPPKESFWARAGRTLFGSFNENKTQVPNINSYDEAVYKAAPKNWGELTPDIKTRLASVKEGTVITQAIKEDEVPHVDKHGKGFFVKRRFLVAAYRENGQDHVLPMVNGGNGNGPVEATLYGGHTKIVEKSQKHNNPDDLKHKDTKHNFWGVPVYIFTQNFEGRDGIYGHPMCHRNVPTKAALPGHILT